jgi:hypothetical protein
MPHDLRGREDVMRPGHPAANGAPASDASAQLNAGQAMPGPEAAAAPLSAVMQSAGILAGLTGLWVAISPWFLTLQLPASSANAKISDLIVGLAVAIAGLLAAGSLRGLASLAGAGLTTGIWLIIAPFILAAKYSVTASMYWSNIWSGGIVIVACLALLGASLARTAR